MEHHSSDISTLQQWFQDFRGAAFNYQFLGFAGRIWLVGEVEIIYIYNKFLTEADHILIIVTYTDWIFAGSF